jgi:transcriptional regulator with XRE-family HTH domain
VDQAHVRRGRTPVIEPVEPTRLIGERVAAIRRYKGMTQEALANALQAVGINIERIVIAKLESGRRSFVKVDELLALCVVLEISVVDLLVPKDLDNTQSYRIVPNATAGAGYVREFVRGEDVLAIAPYPPPPANPEVPFASPGTVIDPLQWMPFDRAQRIARRYNEEYEEDH